MLIFFIVFSLLFEHWKGIQNLKNEKAIAELALLKTQINPHFFFNTLNNYECVTKKALHGGTQVKSGEKWVCNLWVRKYKYP